MATTEVKTSKLDTLKLLIAFGLLAAGIFGFYYYAEESVLYRSLGLLAVMVVVFLIAYQTALGRLGWQYLQDSRVELRKVIWPTRNETMQMTLMVCILVLVAGAFLWLVDLTIGWGVGKLIGVEG